jgi:hypothetical protein
MIKKNPYRRASENPKTLNSVVVYLDVLGVREEIRKSYKVSNPMVAIECLRNFRKALNKSINHLKDKIDGTILGDIRHWEVKAFTDNIVLGYPISSDGEAEMGSTFFHLSLFQLEMVLSGYFVRGAFSIGQHYMDTEIVFGDALLEAYDAEQNTARDPRIILTDSAVKYLKKHLKYYDRVKHSPQYRDILKDVDGQFFLNYLDILINDDGHVRYKDLGKHRDVIEEHLRIFKSNSRIWNKYSWVANYHNYFCEERNDIDTKYKVNYELFRLQPSRIS